MLTITSMLHLNRMSNGCERPHVSLAVYALQVASRNGLAPWNVQYHVCSFHDLTLILSLHQQETMSAPWKDAA